MTDPQIPPPPPPPPPSRPNYVLFGLLGSLIGFLIVVILLLINGGGDAAPAPTAAATTSIVPSTVTSATSPPTTTPPSTAPPSTAPATTVPTSTASGFQGETSTKVADGDFLGTFNFLRKIRVRQRAGFTRVVFDFEPGMVPWWSVGYTVGPFIDQGDNPIPVAGSAFLEVLMSSSGYDLSGGEVRITYEGPDRIPADSVSVAEIVRTEDFEGVSTWIIGLDGERPFNVGTLDSPPLVYIDIGD